MLKQLRPALVLFLLFAVLTGLVYPLAMTGVAQTVFRDQATGSLIREGDRVVGSALIGQGFSDPKYFHPRPSATLAADPNDAAKSVAAPYNAANSSGSNLGPTSRALLDQVKERIAALESDAIAPGAIPVDMVTASGSGLDPDISPASAAMQVPRIAKVRGLVEADVMALVERHTQMRQYGILGERRVNVLALNRALDELAAR